MNLNQVTIIGNLGKDPYTAEWGGATAIAVAADYKGKDGEWIKKTVWVDVFFAPWQIEKFGDRLRKGARIIANGKLENTKKDAEGRTKLVVRIVALDIIPPVGNTTRSDGNDMDEDDLPF